MARWLFLRLPQAVLVSLFAMAVAECATAPALFLSDIAVAFLYAALGAIAIVVPRIRACSEWSRALRAAGIMVSGAILLILLDRVSTASWRAKAPYYGDSTPPAITILCGLSPVLVALVAGTAMRGPRDPQPKEPEEPYCDRCGYRLRGLPQRHRCPECGTSYDLQDAAADAGPEDADAAGGV